MQIFDADLMTNLNLVVMKQTRPKISVIFDMKILPVQYWMKIKENQGLWIEFFEFK